MPQHIKESQMLLYTLVDIDVVSSDHQEEVLGTLLVAQLKPMVATLRFKQEEDNISTSVVLEFGQEPNQNQEEDIQEEKPGSEQQDRVLTIQKPGQPLIHSNLTVTTITSEVEH